MNDVRNRRDGVWGGEGFGGGGDGGDGGHLQEETRKGGKKEKVCGGVGVVANKSQCSDVIFERPCGTV